MNGKKEIIDKIKKWINEESLDYGVIEQPYADFQVDLRNPPVSVIIPKNKSDCVTFATYFQLPKENQKALSDLRDKKMELISDLQRSLLLINVEYTISPNLDNIEKVSIGKNIYFDGLTKDRFIDSIFALKRSMVAVELMSQRLQGRYTSNSNRLGIYS